MKDVVEQLLAQRFYTRLGSGIEGPDGFMYLPVFDVARADSPDEISIPELVPEALKAGAGIVVNPDAEQPEMVLTFGQVWSYAEFGSFFYEPEMGGQNIGGPNIGGPDVAGKERSDALEGEGTITVSNPSADYLPLYARQAMRRFLHRAEPNLKWGVLHLQDPALDPPDALVFSLFREDLQSDEDYETLMFMIDWHLPPHYSLRAVAKTSELTDHFYPL